MQNLFLFQSDLLHSESDMFILCKTSGHDLTVIGNGSVPRPEEDRMTLAEKSERLNQQLKVCVVLKQNSHVRTWLIDPSLPGAAALFAS